MQTERVTFLTTPDHKAALDAFAASNGISTGRVVREATTRYIAEQARDEEEALAFLVREVEAAVPRMRDDIRETTAAMRRSIEAVSIALRADEDRS